MARPFNEEALHPYHRDGNGDPAEYHGGPLHVHPADIPEEPPLTPEEYLAKLLLKDQ